jgi:hypothetical protein
MPTERVEHRTPSTRQELEELSTEQLAMLVAEGRERRRLRAVPDASDWRHRGPSHGVGDDVVDG